MAPRKPMPAAGPKPPVLSAKVTKTKAKKVKNASTKDRNHAAKTSNTYRKKRYRNGILNLEQAPVHLVAAVKHNAESPLLRLPPEIRNRIWSLAMGGQLVKFTEEANPRVKYLRFPLFEQPFSTGIWVVPIRLTSALHLPEVCRQIYSETALTLYKENTFIYERCKGSTKNPLDQLLVAQRTAMASLIPGPLVLETMLLGWPHHLTSLRKRHLPNLQTIFITRPVMEAVKILSMGYGTRWTLDQWQRHFSSRIKAKEGNDVKVIFE